MVDNRNPELLGPILLSLHNLTFYQYLMAQARLAVREDNYKNWARQWADYK
jgi:tRNA-guanine family transglycosylase